MKQELLIESRSNITVGLDRRPALGSCCECVSPHRQVWKLFGEGLKLYLVRMTVTSREIMDNKTLF